MLLIVYLLIISIVFSFHWDGQAVISGEFGDTILIYIQIPIPQTFINDVCPVPARLMGQVGHFPTCNVEENIFLTKVYFILCHIHSQITDW